MLKGQTKGKAKKYRKGVKSMVRVIQLTDSNKKLAEEYMTEMYKASISEKRSNWFKYQKHQEAAGKKKEILCRHLLISPVLYEIKIDMENSCMIVT